MRVADLKQRDVIRYKIRRHSSRKDIIAIVRRTYTSGGKAGASITGVYDDGAAVATHIEGNVSVELLWRQDDSGPKE